MAAPGRRSVKLFASELVGTALLIAIGLSIVIAMFGAGSPAAHLLPGAGARRLITGFLFGATGALIAVSPVGRVSGAHINPAVTLAFWLERKLPAGEIPVYVVAQLAGAVLGALPLFAWGAMGRSVAFAATLPGPGFGPWLALAGETGCTAIMVFLLFVCLGHAHTRPFTPLLFPFLYALLVFAEAPVSGTSTNPARSLGPAVIAVAWRGHWVYWAGPLLGAALAVAVVRLELLGSHHAPVAKLFHFHVPRGGRG